MILFDMKRLSMRLYIGSSEPGASQACCKVEPEYKRTLVAITNALWKQRHSSEGGTIFRGTVLKKLNPGVATLITYKDGSVDILEWNDGIPIHLVSDAKQLKHLILKDGKVVQSVRAGGGPTDSEIGLGFLLSEDASQGGYDNWAGYWGGYWNQPQHTYGPDWFIATRSAFGVRSDGNLVFAVGHHISTKDMAKALALAGCRNAIHGDANPHNVLGNFYYNDGNGKFSRKVKLSPEQKDSTLDRYVDKSYTSDYYGFFLKSEERDS